MFCFFTVFLPVGVAKDYVEGLQVGSAGGGAG